MKNSFIYIKFKQSIFRNCKNNKKLYSKNKIKLINKNMLIMMMRQQKIQFVILVHFKFVGHAGNHNYKVIRSVCKMKMKN